MNSRICKVTGAGLASLTLVFSPAAFPVSGAVPSAIPSAKSAPAMVTLPACRNNHGQLVSFRETTTRELKREGVGLAVSYKDSAGIPRVDYDAKRLSRTPPEFQEDVLYHECAHHALGHPDLSQAAFNAAEKKYEEQADCHAFQKLVREKNFGYREIKIIADTMDSLYPHNPNAAITWSVSNKKDVLTRCLKAMTP